MGVFDKLFRHRPRSEQSSIDISAGIEPGTDSVDSYAFTSEDFQRSQYIYNRNLIDVFTYEVQPQVRSGEPRDTHLVVGRLVEMTEGLLTLGVIAKSETESQFRRHGEVSITYSKHGDSYYTKARVVESSLTGFDDIDEKARRAMDDAIARGYYGGHIGGSLRKYAIQLVLINEPVRHHRKHGRIAIEWDVYFRPVDDETHGEHEALGETNTPKDGGFRATCSHARTIDISEGGFKGSVAKHVAKGTDIRCIIDVGFDEESAGKLIGTVKHCCPSASGDSFEMTVQFIEMDASTREFLGFWIEKMLPAPINSEARVKVSDDKSEASLELIPPENNGADLSYDELRACLENENIVHGVDFELLKHISEMPHYNYVYTIAHCTPPTNGEDAVLDFNVDMNPSFSPKVNEEGFVDFKNMGQIHKVSMNDVLAVKKHLTSGEPGTTVTGDALDATPGKDVPFPAGKNTGINDADTELFAACDGFVSIVDGKINVLDTYVVEGDVQYTTGNIDHNGIVIVKGDVRQGFSVSATGDVIVHGTVESASISAGGTLVVRGGCVGEENNIDVHGNVAVKFLDGGTLKTGGSLTTSYILNSIVKCGDCVEMVDYGLIRNSYVVAKNAINAKTIGGVYAAADKTIVEVGSDPALVSRYAVVSAEQAKLGQTIESVQANIRGLTVLKYKNQLSDKKLETLETFKRLAGQLTAQQEELAREYSDLIEQMNKLGYGSVNVKDIAYEGLKVIVGTCEMILQSSVKSARFYRNNDSVAIGSLSDGV